jgi:transposase
MSLSKFTESRRQRALEVLRAGGSRRQAALAAGVDHSTLSDWIHKGEHASPASRYRAFADAVAEAEGTPPQLREIKREYDDPPDWVRAELARAESRVEQRSRRAGALVVHDIDAMDAVDDYEGRAFEHGPIEYSRHSGRILSVNGRPVRG